MMQKRNVLNSPGLLELKKRKQKIFLNKIFIFLFGILVFFLLFAYLSRLNNLNINEVEIAGNKVLEKEILKDSVKNKIAGKYLWLFPKTNILIYPKNNIKNELQDEFKRIKNINLTIKNNKILEISLIEREAKYIWCETTLSENINNQKCFFVDEDGYIFDEAPYFSGEVYFKFYDLTHNNSLGSYLLKQNFKQLIIFKDMLVDLGLKPIALNIINNENAEIILSKGVSATNEPKIIFKINENFQNITENLQAALDTEPLKSKFKNKYSTLQYIDLRFKNKVYDKFN